MKVAIMQPYFFPYIGYFQLMNAVDEFVVYDNIEFTKKGWINRNRMLVNGKDVYFSLPLKAASDFLHIKERQLANTWPDDSRKMLNKIKEAYRKAPHFEAAFAVTEECILHKADSLFEFIFHSLARLKDHLGISSKLIVSSAIPVDHSLKAEKKVLEICKARKANTYINPSGGTALYSKEIFAKENLHLNFLNTGTITYKQFDAAFVPFLSILDVMMFNPKEKISEYLNTGFTLS